MIDVEENAAHSLADGKHLIITATRPVSSCNRYTAVVGVLARHVGAGVEKHGAWHGKGTRRAEPSRVG